MDGRLAALMQRGAIKMSNLFQYGLVEAVFGRGKARTSTQSETCIRCGLRNMGRLARPGEVNRAPWHVGVGEVSATSVRAP